MKFDDIRVGKTYSNGQALIKLRKVVYKGENYVVAEIEGYTYPAIYQGNTCAHNPYKNWELVLPKIKVYQFYWGYKTPSTTPVLLCKTEVSRADIENIHKKFNNYPGLVTSDIQEVEIDDFRGSNEP